jgi:hypothetical protein
MIIRSSYSLLSGVVPEFDQLTIKNEPMLFNCDYEHALELGGPVTKTVLSNLPRDWRDVPLVIDSRVHMLMPGWIPCIPGWHHDDVPRTREDGQPNYGPDQPRSQHIVCLLNGDICPTAFATGTLDFAMPGLGKVIYGELHEVVEQAIHDGHLTLSHAPSNRLVLFDDRTWHTGTSALSNGWRFFIRISRYFSPAGQPIARGNERTNELRRQVQVYLPAVNGGW